MYKQQKPFWTTQKILLTSLIVFCIIGSIFYAFINYHKKGSTSSYHSKNHFIPKGTPSKPTVHKSTSTNTLAQGGVTQQTNAPTTSSLPPSSDWVTSTSGNITLQQPSPNASIQSGSTISGLAKVSSVQFILTDSKVGLIAQGTLSVINGKFSGIMHFTPHSPTGKLQVFYSNPNNGAEEDVINLNVNYN